MKVSNNELLKQNCPTLAGTIAQNLRDPGTEFFSEDDIEFLKFHGIYQADDRDLRKTGKKYIFMVRLHLPAGVITPAQYLACDELATRYANDTLRITSRQSLQFHGIVKAGLGPLIKKINEALLSTLAACGDVNRNVMAPPTPATSAIAEKVREDAQRVAAELEPRTQAYRSIWVEGVELNLDPEFTDPLYGKTYLPRKFKIGFAIPPINDVDILTHCCGFIAIADSNQNLLGYNLCAGGGMGRSHGNNETFPRVADLIGFLTPNQVSPVAKAVLTIHRDFGDRGNRKHARLKYVIADRGPAWFREELERRLGFALQEPRPYKFESQGDRFGWHKQADGRLFLGLFIETGRIKDHGTRQIKTALREVVSRYGLELRFTPGNNVLLVNIKPELRQEITDLLATFGLRTDAEQQGSRLRRSSMACVSLPTCKLALAESERYLPKLITEVEKLLAEIGLHEEEITIRMTGCPNGCARPYMAEIGLVGKAPGRYQLYTGGNLASTRLNRLHLDNVKDADLVSELKSLLLRYKAERLPQERFGDWAARLLWTKQDASGAGEQKAPTLNNG
jgi:sulfite reductase (NADPH) hemoprotein beta-component